MSRIPRTALALVLAAYLLPLALPAPLMEDDEGLHAAIAQEMVERGDWTVPRLLGEPFLDKPILYFWMQAASLATFGDGERAVRLPGTVVALLGAAAVAWLGATMFGSAVGPWAGLAYATMLLPYGVSLAPLHDLVMVPLVTLAVGAFYRARYAVATGELLRWTLVAGVALGGSILGKGLTGVGLVGIGVAAWLLWSRALSWRLVAVGLAAVALGAIIAWPWYAAMERAVPGYLQYFFAERHLGGLTEDTQRHAGRPWWYYLPIVVAGTFPWLAALWQRWRPLDDGQRLLWAWLVADLLVLSAAGSKLATYLLPALPAVAVLCGVAITRAASTPTREGTAALPIATWVMAAVGVVLMPATAYAMDLPLPLTATAVSLVVHAALVAWAMRSLSAPPVRLLAVTTSALLVAALGALPVAAQRFTAKPLAERINSVGALPSRLLIVDEGIGSFVFYLRPELRRQLTAGRVARVSRFSVADEVGQEPAAGTMVAVAADRLAGVVEHYDLGPAEGLTAPDFVVLPLERFVPRPQR